MARADSPSLVLDDQLCFALYSASRAMTAAYRERLRPVGLTYTQYVVMLVLWEESPITLGRLCERLQLDSATLTPVLKRLEAQGMVTRRRLERDERVLEIDATAAGQALCAEVGRIQDTVEASCGLEPGELVELRSELQSLAARLRVSEGPDRT